MVNQQHPYYITAVNIYPRIVQGLMQAQQISPQEANWLQSLMRGPQFSSFIESLICQVGSIQGEGHMEKLIVGNFIEPIINDNRAAMAQRAGYGGGYGYGGYGGGGFGRGFGGYNPGYGGGGYDPRRMMGGCPPTGSSWYSGRKPGGFSPRYMGARGPGGQITNGQSKTQEQQTTPAKKPAAVKWAEPQLDSNASVNLENKNNTYVSLRRFTGSDNVPIIEAFVVDDRPLYKSDAEAIEAYRGLIDEEKSKQILTVCYRKLIVLKTDRTAFKTLVQAASTAISNYGPDDLAKKIKTIMAVSADHPSGAVNAFHKLIVDEFNAHILCGELNDSAKGHVSWKVCTDSLQGILDLVSNNLDKKTRETLHQIKDFDNALHRIVSKVLSTVVGNGTASRIFNPVSDPTIMDIYGRALPPVWKNCTTNVWETTDNFFARYVTANKKTDGAKSETAQVAEQTLKTRLAAIDRNYTVLQVPRIITWSNCSASTVVSWDGEGKCIPSVWTPETINNDIAYFLNRVLVRIDKSKLMNYAACTRRLICEVDEGTVSLDYGHTSDGALWIGCLRFKY